MTTFNSFAPARLPVPKQQPIVVLADDDEDIIKLVSFRLERSGYRVVSVRNGAEAVRLATELLPAIVVLDVSMPVMSGIEATRALRAAPETAGLPIILLTARTAEADVAAGSAAGATAYVTKPFSPQDLARRVEDSSPMADAQLLLEGRSGAVEIVDRHVRRAAAAGASDLHFVPQPDGMLVRIRVDGVLHDTDRVSSTVGTTLAARIKVMARLDVADREKAQDGRFATDDLDIRVSVLPTVLGEGLILRLLRTDAVPPSLTNLGLDNEMQMNLERILSRPHGLLVVAGPTGAGKSTTLYAALDDVNSPAVNIVTVEDPVEYRVERAYQVQVNEKRGLTFPTALRSILRSDPDIIMVGEIRDSETAQLVLEASLSGHLVLSTVHSDNSPRALTRLGELGAPTHLLCSAVTAILSQRLARRLCPVCREAYTPSPGELDLLGWGTDTQPDEISMYRARGCEECTRGYAGRIGIFQLLLMSDDIAAALRQSGTHTEVDAAATRGGMRTLWEDGARKVQAGLTSFEELRRVVL